MPLVVNPGNYSPFGARHLGQLIDPDGVKLHGLQTKKSLVQYEPTTLKIKRPMKKKNLNLFDIVKNKEKVAVYGSQVEFETLKGKEVPVSMEQTPMMTMQNLEMIASAKALRNEGTDYMQIDSGPTTFFSSIVNDRLSGPSIKEESRSAGIVYNRSTQTPPVSKEKKPLSSTAATKAQTRSVAGELNLFSWS